MNILRDYVQTGILQKMEWKLETKKIETGQPSTRYQLGNNISRQSSARPRSCTNDIRTW